ncbi:flagellar type III secretion system pore protein FliP [Borrelia miyamotoi]|uniref:Flagellar biosynthetic protein FliP n=1 Tax=Borrelia miyamotoi TaxID=47466 RepID=A0AAX3JMS5_9SPIR|nr:flagellar type III secretion system pore protein FliP [Borrelia miyamotoi]QFP42044.1 flagellar type III secretion system pore protein FliP [Borrelia miyamotoi]QFP48160.1 flagellar type III secretion system pore protein FliP [Borrelia miyamotoi]QGT55920.1 flagellar type III secretion system pore protein FliP [Borrelia miyamotoi]QGT56699.1 flagellar type III secretion system pore protein FliP [Borrelia miyamotoi]WAZ71959.1 flagellar type III secretion system pore protein FliP [Borrelia miyamo
MNKKLSLFLFFGSINLLFAQTKSLQPTNGLNFPFVDFINSGGSGIIFPLQILLILTIITLSPAFLVLMTSFLRIAIVLDFIRRALSLQQSPPNQIIMGLALFLTIFTMWPTFNIIYKDAYLPLKESKIGFNQFYDKGIAPLRNFMYKQMSNSRHEEIRLFMKISNYSRPKNFSEVPTHVLIASFILHELKIAFKMGILIFLPFIVIDIIVSAVLMAMGMIMLPPVMISLPFKLILFVMVDGWTLITSGLVKSFM